MYTNFVDRKRKAVGDFWGPKFLQAKPAKFNPIQKEKKRVSDAESVPKSNKSDRKSKSAVSQLLFPSLFFYLFLNADMLPLLVQHKPIY